MSKANEAKIAAYRAKLAAKSDEERQAIDEWLREELRTIPFRGLW